MRLIYYQDKADEWRWHMIAANGRTVADSGEGYSTKWNCKRAARKFVRKLFKEAIWTELKPTN